MAMIQYLIVGNLCHQNLHYFKGTGRLVELLWTYVHGPCCFMKVINAATIIMIIHGQ